MKPLSWILMICFLAFAPQLSAQGFWDPPGEDPCDNPLNPPCYEDAYPGDAIGGAATEVGRATDEYAETDLAWGFIYWLAETFGPNIPQPEPEPDPDDEEEEEESSQSTTLATGVWVVDGQEANENIRAYFDHYAEGQQLQTDAKHPDRFKVRYILTYKREDLPSVPEEYDLTVKMSVRGPRGNVRHQPIHILAEPGKVYFISPKRRAQR